MTREEYIERNVGIFKKLIPYAEKYGIRLLIENTGWTVNNTNLSTADDLNEILDRIDHPLFGVCWDTGHANLCDLDQYAELKKLGSRLEGLHVHDNYGTRAPGCDLHQFPYWGNVNFDGVISALLEIGYKGTFNFEVDNPVRRSGAIPFVKDGVEQKKLEMMSPALRQQMETFLFAIGKQMLEKYDCFEE
jgi:sugar phosphate isomerase/epimerase